MDDSNDLITPVWRDYESIIQELMWIDKNTKLIVKTKIHRKTKNNRIPYLSEIEYFNTVWQEDVRNVNIVLDTMAYIKQIKPVNGIKAEIGLKMIDIYKLYTALEKMHNELNTNYDKYFAKDGNTFLIRKTSNDNTLITVPAQFDMYIGIEPAIVHTPGKDPEGGVRILLNDISNSIIIDLDTVLSLIVELKNLNLCELGALMPLHLNSPFIGKNVTNMNKTSHFHK